MKVKAVRPFVGSEGSVKPGQVVEVSEARAEQLKRRGLVVDVAAVRAAAKPAAKKAARKPRKQPAAPAEKSPAPSA